MPLLKSDEKKIINYYVGLAFDLWYVDIFVFKELSFHCNSSFMQRCILSRHNLQIE